jgi:hypothetical protein
VSRSVRLVAIIAALCACIDTPPLHEPEVQSSHVEIKDLPGGLRPQADVLVVIDDSIAMLPYRERIDVLGRQLGAALADFPRHWFDVQIAVTGNDGRFRGMLAEAWHYDYSQDKSFTGELADAVYDLVKTDSFVTGPPQPLEAMRRALERNGLFVRDNAQLVVVTISADDDASPLAVDDYVSWTRALAGDAQGWSPKLVTMIGIYPEDAPRLAAYYGALTRNVRSISTPLDEDFGTAIANVRPLARTHLGLACLENLDDLDPLAAGFQHECTLHVYLDDELLRVPECGAAAELEIAPDADWSSRPSPPCWELEHEPYCYGSRPMTWRWRGYTNLSHPPFRLECRTR